MAGAGLSAGEVEAIGITNQRETTVIWDRATGRPIHNAIVWQDTRTAALVRELSGEAGPDRLRERVGLPLSTYFSGRRSPGCSTTCPAPAPARRGASWRSGRWTAGSS